MSEQPDPKLDRIDRLSLWGFIALSAACLAVAVLYLTLHEYLLAASLAVQALVWGSFTYVRKNWISLGYARGQWAAIMHAREARDRGLTGDEWINCEIERATGITILAIHPEDAS